ncbi:hypothetical protein M388_03230 [Mesotoga sp. Brook.08.YT.4.2.5.4.]|nr:hypothetical protein M388_03230 [Mesotoga sp. Brook.08.YT.4.2.5.4.]
MLTGNRKEESPGRKIRGSENPLPRITYVVAAFLLECSVKSFFESFKEKASKMRFS